MAHPLEDAPDRPELSVVVPTYGGQRTLPVLVDRQPNIQQLTNQSEVCGR